MLVLALHTAYLAALFTGALAPHALLLLALAAYATYVDQRRAVHPEAARRAAAGPRPLALAEAAHEARPRSKPPLARPATGAPNVPCCASAASARCSAA